MKDLLSKMLKSAPQERLSIEEVITELGKMQIKEIGK